MVSPHPTAHFDLALSLNETSEGVSGNLEYTTDLFDRRTVERFVTCLQTLLGAMCIDDSVSVMRLSLLTPQERDDIIEGFNSSRGETGMAGGRVTEGRQGAGCAAPSPSHIGSRGAGAA